MSISPFSSSLPSGRPSATQQQQLFTISCTGCRQRKIKCPRTQPCLPCLNAGYDCEFPTRQRVSRKKRGNMVPQAKVADLAKRLAGVEALLSQMVEKEEESPADSDTETPESLDSMANGEQRYAECAFWTALCEQIGGLNDLISSESSPKSNISSSQTPEHIPETFSNLVSTSKPTNAPPIRPSHTQALTLLNFFILNVDPIIKVVHVPSLQQQINDQASSQYGRAKLKQTNDTVIASVYFASVTSMTEEECQTHLQISKKSAVATYKAAVEDGLARSHFMHRADVTTLQALVLFIGCIRSTDSSKAPWTMFALLVRLAHSLNLHRDGQGLQYTPLEAEMRRRLWWQIVLLDLRASEEWGSDSMIHENSFNTCIPTNIDDCDMAPNATSTYTNCNGVTGMTFSLLFREAVTMAKLFHIPLDHRGTPSLQDRLKVVLGCQNELNENFYPRYISDAPIAVATHTVGRLMIYKAWLLVHYPMKSQDWTAMETTVKREDLLMTSTMIIELSYKLESSDDMRPWRWLFKTYIQWHALAVTLVELCVQSESPLKNKAWAIVDIVFDLWSKRVVDTSAGYVWWPLKRLHAKAHQIRVSNTFNQSLASKIPSISASVTPEREDQTFIHHGSNGHDAGPNTTSQAASNVNMALESTQTHLGFMDFDIDKWDYSTPFHNGDPLMHANWADWDGFMHDANDVHDRDFMS